MIGSISKSVQGIFQKHISCGAIEYKLETRTVTIYVAGEGLAGEVLDRFIEDSREGIKMACNESGNLVKGVGFCVGEMFCYPPIPPHLLYPEMVKMFRKK